MPQAVIPVLLSAAVSGGAAALAGAGFWAAFGTTLVLGALSYALTPKPKKPNIGSEINIRGNNVSIRQSDLTRSFVYGHTRVTKGYAHMESTGVNGTMHIILILCDGPLRAINEVWVNDYAIPNDWIDSQGNITQGRYAGHMTIRKHLGTDTQGADSTAVSNMSEWTSDHRLQGIAYLYIRMFKNQDIYPNGVPNFSAVVEGRTVNDPRVGTSVWTTNIALLAADFILNEQYGLGAFDEDIDDENTSVQANICDEIQDTEDLDTEVTSVDTSLDLLTLQGDLLLYQFGDRVILVTEGTPPAGLAVDTDYYVIPYQIKDTPRIGLAVSLDDALAKNYINITDSGSGTFIIRKTGEPRYHGGGVVETEAELTTTLNDLCSSMAGRAINVGGFWTLLAGAWRTPTLTLTIDDIRGLSTTIKNCQSMSESFNQVQGLFISSINYFQPTNYPAAFYDQFLSEDNNISLVRELNLPFTNRPTTAQRIAKIELFKARQDISYVSNFSMKALQLQPGDTVNLNIERYGWTPKIFEVTDFTFDSSDGALVTKLSLRETAEQIFDWSQGEAIAFDPAPNTSLPNPFQVLVPTGVKFNSRLIETTGSDVLYAIQLQWDLHPDAFVTQYGDFELQFKPSSSEEWLPSFFVDGQLTKSDLFTSSPGVLYDLRIRARNNLGVRSNWVTIFNATVGASGGVVDTQDWGFVNEAADSSPQDWGFVNEAADSSPQDWGFVA